MEKAAVAPRVAMVSACSDGQVDSLFRVIGVGEQQGTSLGGLEQAAHARWVGDSAP